MEKMAKAKDVDKLEDEIELDDLNFAVDDDVLPPESFSSLEDTNQKPKGESLSPAVDSFDEWAMFVNECSSTHTGNSGPKASVKIDNDLFYTLDDCNIQGASKTRMINAILRSFITAHINQLAKYRKSRQTLFNN